MAMINTKAEEANLSTVFLDDYSLTTIFRFFDVKNLVRARRVCKNWKRIADQHEQWEDFLKRDFFLSDVGIARLAQYEKLKPQNCKELYYRCDTRQFNPSEKLAISSLVFRLQEDKNTFIAYLKARPMWFSKLGVIQLHCELQDTAVLLKLSISQIIQKYGELSVSHLKLLRDHIDYGLEASHLLGKPDDQYWCILLVKILDSQDPDKRNVEQALQAMGVLNQWQIQILAIYYPTLTREDLCRISVNKDSLTALKYLASYDPSPEGLRNALQEMASLTGEQVSFLVKHQTRGIRGAHLLEYGNDSDALENLSIALEQNKNASIEQVIKLMQHSKAQHKQCCIV